MNFLIFRSVADWVDVKGVVLLEKLKSEVLACHKSLNNNKKD